MHLMRRNEDDSKCIILLSHAPPRPRLFNNKRVNIMEDVTAASEALQNLNPLPSDAFSYYCKGRGADWRAASHTD